MIARVRLNASRCCSCSEGVNQCADSTILTIAGISAASILLLAACQTPRLNLFRYGEPGTPLAVGDEVKIDFFTNEMNFNTGVALDAGAGYALDITILKRMDRPRYRYQRGRPKNSTSWVSITA